jgi:hypothetical protein
MNNMWSCAELVRLCMVPRPTVRANYSSDTADLIFVGR